MTAIAKPFLPEDIGRRRLRPSDHLFRAAAAAVRAVAETGNADDAAKETLYDGKLDVNGG